MEENISLPYEVGSIFKKSDLYLPNDTLSVGCCIKNTNDKTKKVQKLDVHTEILTEKLSLKCPLAFQLNRNPMQQILTLPLVSVSKKYPDFYLVLTSPGYKHDVESLIVQIKMAKSSSRIFAACKLSIEDSDGNVRYLNDGEYWFQVNTDDNTRELKNCIRKQKCIFQRRNSNFTLNCLLSITDGTYTNTKVESSICSSSGNEAFLQSAVKYPQKLPFQEKLRSLYSDGTLCDFTIHVDDKDFLVHKIVLGSVSPVLCAMFQLDMKEKANSSLLIEDIDADTMQKLIDFAYNGSLDDLQWDSAIKLFSAADKYEMLELKQICAEFMNSKLEIENVTEALTMADLHQDNYLKNAAENFLYSNFHEVFTTGKWKDFMENSMKLANNLMCRIVARVSENNLR